MYHGKLFTTKSGANLDEVKSLLQKSLRRKDEKRVAQCNNELIYKHQDPKSGKLITKDQLQWGFLVTYLFEDHCLVDADSLYHLYECVQRRDKSSFLKNLLTVRTCRIAACLPVFVMSGDVNPKYDTTIKVPPLLQGLFDHSYQKFRHLNDGSILAHFIEAWKQTDEKALMFYAKLINMMHDVEKAEATEKAKDLVKTMVERKRGTYIGATHIVISILLSDGITTDIKMRRFLHMCLRFCCIPDSSDVRRDACHRLILFSVVTRKIHGKDVDTTPVKMTGGVVWNEVSPLSDMPSYAVDKHTYRGKTGQSTQMYKEQANMSDLVYHDFHGNRPKRGIQDFFNEGSVIWETSLKTNPYWETTKMVYLSAPPDKQKTRYMTFTFYEKLFQDHKDMFVFDPRTGGLLPLLQKPTSGNKVYTRVDLVNNQVIKGPYPEAKYNLVVYYHQKMIEMGDVHTLPITEDYPYLRFPLVKGDVDEVCVVKKDIDDHIANIRDIEVDFVERKALGLVQLHKMKHDDIMNQPMTVWNHYALRYILGVGDSGLYNAIYNGRNLYGIDMEEKRGKVDESKFTSVCQFLFSSLPSKDVCKLIEDKIRKNHKEYLQMLYAILGDVLTKESIDCPMNVKLNKLITFVRAMSCV